MLNGTPLRGGTGSAWVLPARGLQPTGFPSWSWAQSPKHAPSRSLGRNLKKCSKGKETQKKKPIRERLSSFPPLFPLYNIPHIFSISLSREVIYFFLFLLSLLLQVFQGLNQFENVQSCLPLCCQSFKSMFAVLCWKVGSAMVTCSLAGGYMSTTLSTGYGASVPVARVCFLRLPLEGLL